MRARSLLLMLTIGCGGATGKPLHSFPTREALANIAAQQPTTGPLAIDLAPAERWTLELPAHGAENAAHALLPKLVPRAKASPAMDCVAHELARFLSAAEDKQPGMSLRRFMAARCGALVQLPLFQSWLIETAPGESDAAMIARLDPQLKMAIDAAATEAGVGVARAERRAVLVVAYGRAEVALQPFEQVIAEGNAIRLRGRVLSDVEGLHGYINSGAYGVTPCELDPGVAAPEFALSCELAPGDEAAWLQLIAQPRGRVIAHEVLGMIALRSPDAAKIYDAPQVGKPHPVADGASFQAAVFELLNGVRASAGLRPLQLAREQSQVASSVTPAFFTAMLSEGQAAKDSVDAITLGLLAGWDVRGGIISSGDLTASLVIDALDAERWLADALERPLGRAVMLDPEARVLALGSMLQQEPVVLAAVALTYAFFEDEPKDGARAMQVLERLGRVRQARGLGKTILVSDTPGMQEQTARVHRGEATPGAALQAAMHEVSATLRVPVQGFIWETQDLDRIEFPPELLQRGDLTLGAGVTYYRAPGGAWGQYAVLFVVINPSRRA